MKTLHFECFAGISGDMTLGALVDLGVDPARLVTELKKLNLDGWKLDFVKDQRNGITGTRALVEIAGEDHNRKQEEHTHHHGYEHDHHHHHEHSHNTWKEIRRVIEASFINGGAKRRALDIFSRIAAAESEVHGVPVEEIGFHEVGALDSIIDIVGAAICLDLLAPDHITAGRVELGGGTVRCAHGELPVPAPATLILCKGMPVHTGSFDAEMTTPTGAAILASQVDEFVHNAAFTELKTGYGLGTRKLDKPNVLRVSWREDAQPAAKEQDLIEIESILMESNIDDMTGEELAFLMECLFREGARDVVFVPCMMKKNRPGTLVSVLCPPEKLAAMRNTMFTQSKTIGIRETPAHCFALRRKEASIVNGGSCAGKKKIVYYGGKELRDKIEFEDRADLARRKNISLWEAEELIRKGERHD
ncbi:MAG: nickel pincer cofactor biosynthesis protein LarC [Treponema sp.]|nr:nickel pincer cofactor biosynthesis protein LarC [Treponema sp.]